MAKQSLCMTRPLFDEEHLNRIEKMWTQGYYLKKSPEVKKEIIKEAITRQWRTAKEISDATGVSYKATAKILTKLAQFGFIRATEYCFVDDRFRKRKRFMYKIDDTADAVAILDKIFGVKKVK